MKWALGTLLVVLLVACSSPTEVATTETDPQRVAEEAEAFRVDAQRQIEQAEAAAREAERVIAEQTRQAQIARQRERASRSKVTTPRARTAPREVTPVSGDIFDALARCESGMRRVTGGRYHSYFQWSLGTWHSLGFSGMPEDYDYATQKAAAQRLVARSGWGQFPVCSRKIGAR